MVDNDNTLYFISANILSIDNTINKNTAVVHDIPSKSYFRGWFTMIINTKNNILAYQIGNENIWYHLFTYSIICQEISLQNFITGFLNDNKIKTTVI